MCLWTWWVSGRLGTDRERFRIAQAEMKEVDGLGGMGWR